MLVCGHGNVRDFCTEREMVIVCKHTGNIEEYTGVCRVIVTDQEMSESEYHYLKSKMIKKGYELVSTRYVDTEEIARLIARYATEVRSKNGGRCKFGYHRVNGEMRVHEGKMAVVRRILELADKGFLLREIQSDDGVHHMNGRDLSLSTIHLIIKNRKDYGL